MPNSRRNCLAFLPALAWAGGVFVLSSQPQLPTTGLEFPYFDKVAHFLVYGVLCGLLLLGANGPRGRSALKWALLASAYGITDEVHQVFVPGRSPDVLDWVADTLGALCCVMIWLAFNRYLRPKPRDA